MLEHQREKYKSVKCILRKGDNMKKALMMASVASMIYKFNMDNIEILEGQGFEVHVACNFGNENPISKDEINKFMTILQDKKIQIYDIDCPRSIFKINKIIKTYRQLIKIVSENHYDIVHCQSPIGGAICRWVCKKARKNGTKVIYTAHGFHFFKGGPVLNWIFYPVERFLSRYTDILITINEEDYQRATRFKAKKVVKIPSVGIDVNKFSNTDIDRNQKKKEFNIPKDSFVILSVGELSERKNHEVIIKAISKLKFKNIYYLICGQGEKENYLRNLIKSLNIEDRVILAGYRNDINEIVQIANCFAFPSKREGLGLASVEAMTVGIPIITSNINGILEYSEDGITGFAVSPKDINGFAKSIEVLYKNPDLCKKMGEYNRKIALKFDKNKANSIMKSVYQSIVN